MAFGQIGYFVKLHNEQLERKASVKNQFCKNISEELLTVIDFTTNKQKIFWEEEGKEFFYNGEMFDIIKTKNIAGKVMLFCLNDKKEKELIEKYYNITENNSSKDKKAKTTVEPSFSIFILQSTKTSSVQLYSPVKQYGLFVSPLAAGISNQLLQPPTFS